MKLSENILPKDVENGVKLEPNLDLRTTTLGQRGQRFFNSQTASACTE